MNQLRHLDNQILFAVNSFARNTPSLHGLVAGYAKYGLILFLVLLAGALVAARHRCTRDLAATGWAALAPLLALGLNQPLGHLLREPRPYATHPHLLRLADVTTDFSFPSDHAVMAGSVAAGLLLAHRVLGSLAAVATLLMAFASCRAMCSVTVRRRSGSGMRGSVIKGRMAASNHSRPRERGGVRR